MFIRFQPVMIAIIVFTLLLIVHRSPRHVRDQPSFDERAGTYSHKQHGRRDEGRRPDASCAVLGVSCRSEYFSEWLPPRVHGCAIRMDRNNPYPRPDPRCTPGGINPSITVEILRDPRWRTRCARDCQNSEAEKHIAYSWYGIARPPQNYGGNQVCELDHLVPLELGGADGMGNLWPQCGTNPARSGQRFFNLKDRVENYLADSVRRGRMRLPDAQHGIAQDWTQYLQDANRYCAMGGRC